MIKIKLLTIVAPLIFSIGSASASVVNVTSYGAKGDGVTDDTAAIQAAINAAQTGDLVLVPAGTYMINAIADQTNLFVGSPTGISLKSNMNLELAAGAVLQAIPNSVTHYVILQLNGITNVNIIGPGSIVGDRDNHGNQSVDGWWGFGIGIGGGSSNISIQGITVAKCWGDGITIIGASNVAMDKVVTDSNRRQNMSICDGNLISVTNSTFRNAEFSGLDLEPFADGQAITNALIQYNLFTGTVEGPADIGVGSSVGIFRGITINNDQFQLKTQPIMVSGNAGNLGTPWWAFLLNRIFHEGLHDPAYRFWGYPTKWSD